MKMLKIITYTFLFITIFTPTVLAAECSNAEKVSLGKEAVGVKVGDEEAEGIVDPSTYIPADRTEEDSDKYVKYYYYFNLIFNNITENLVLRIENDYNDEVIYVKYDDTDNGQYILEWKNIYQVTTFKYTILASDKTNCEDEILKEGIYTLPKYNIYYNHQKCDTIPNYYLCKKYITTEVDSETFFEKVNSHLKSLEKKEEEKEQIKTENIFDKISKLIKENQTIALIGGVAIVLVGGFVIGVVIRKRRSRVI